MLTTNYITLSDGLNISYSDNKKISSVSLIFIHGNSSSSEVWNDLMHHSLVENYRTISFDWPGHGNSEFAKYPETVYTLDSSTRIIREVVEKLKLQNVVYIGHSVGGHILLQSLPFLISAKGIMTLGTSPIVSADLISDAYCLTDAIGKIFTEELSSEDAFAFSKEAVAPDNFLAAEKLKKQILNTDAKYRKYFAADLGNMKNEWEFLNKASFPIALVSSNFDIVNHDYLSINCAGKNIWRNAVQYIKNSGHSLPMEQPDQIAELLHQYLADLGV